MNNQRGMLTIISGFSGAGKGTVVKEIFNTYKNDYSLSISATTHKPREGEEDGVQYFFLDKEVFEQKIKENEAIFNMTVEDDLLEACIYDGKALRSRYRYYHNMARQMGIRVGEMR